VTSARRELLASIALCLAGAGLVLLALAPDWVTVTAPSELTTKSLTASVGGDKVVGGAQILGFLGLAGVVALAATRGWGRTVVGALLVLAALGIVATVVLAWTDGFFVRAFPVDLKQSCGTAGADDAKTCAALLAAYAGIGIHEHHVWAVLCVVGSVLLAGSGLLVIVRGRRWAALGSSYQVPAARPVEVTDKGTWDALDAGDDPTA